jgi:LytS/YehU family sensor histidine kinase
VTEARLETQLVEARLRTLEAELNPHFLFNTLHAISALLHRDADAADRIISRLSDLLRLTLDRGTGPIVPLKDELECLQKYLDIAQIRFGDRLSVAMQIDPEALDGEVPRMILQPLVENAVKHGISQQSQTGQLAISAAAVGGRLRIEIADDGGGLRAKTPQDGRGGVGLSNTRARLECLYGADHRLDLVDCGSGLTVRVEIPFRRAAATAAAAATFRVA